jgi:hypothetical protein
VTIEGTIQVTGECVLLDTDGQETLLVWTVDATSLDPTTGNITYTNRDGRPQIFSDGNSLVFRGRISTGTPGQTNDDWAVSVTWLSPPATQCLRDSRLFVEDVQIPQ